MVKAKGVGNLKKAGQNPMAAKTVETGDATSKTRDEAPETLVVDDSAQIKALVKRGKERGFVTYDELNAALPSEQVSSEQIEDTMAMLSELGINVVESEETEEATPAATEREDEPKSASGNVDDDTDVFETWSRRLGRSA